MLILTRRPAETIYIGENVTITVLGVVGNQVRFGIEAPRSITIDRAEIHERKKRQALGLPTTGVNRYEANRLAQEQQRHGNKVPPAEEAAPLVEVNGNVAEEPEAEAVDG